MNLKQILNSRLLSNTFNLFVLYGISSIVPILLVPYLLNTIGVEKYGLVNLALIFSFYFQIVNEFGFDLSNVRHIVKNRENISELGKIVSSILQCKFILIVCSSIVYSLVIFFVDTLRSESTLYTLAFIRLIGIVITPYWFFRSMEDVKYITRISVPVKLLCILPIFFIVNSTDDYELVMLCYALETFVSGILALFIMKKRYGIRFQLVKTENIIYYFKDSIPFFSSTFLMRVYKNMNALILGFFVGDFAVGLYTAAEKLHNAYSSFVSPLLSQIFYPYFTRINNINRTTKITILLCVLNTIILACGYFLSPYLIHLFIKTEAASIISNFNLFLFLLVISVPADMLGFPFLGILGKINSVNNTTIYSAFAYMLAIAVLILTKQISIENVILALIFANIICLSSRIYLISKTLNNDNKQIQQ